MVVEADFCLQQVGSDQEDELEIMGFAIGSSVLHTSDPDPEWFVMRQFILLGLERKTICVSPPFESGGSRIYIFLRCVS